MSPSAEECWLHREVVVARKEVSEAGKKGMQLATKTRLAGDVLVQAGDASFFLFPVHTVRRVLCIWNSAKLMGRVAGTVSVG